MVLSKTSLPRGLFALAGAALIGALSSSSPARADAIARINVETAHLRVEPNTKARTRVLLDHGDTLRIVDRKGSWCRVTTGGGVSGWVRSDLVSIVKVIKGDAPASSQKTAAAKAKAKKLAAAKAKAQKLAAAKKAKAQKISAAKAKAQKTAAAKAKAQKAAAAKSKAHKLAVARAKAQKSAAQAKARRTAVARKTVAPTRVRKTVVARKPHTRIAHNDSARKGALAARRAAAAAGRRFRVSGSLTSGNDVVRTAMAFRGVPYRFGARSANSFDCSGFTSYTFAKKGTTLPRTAAEQFTRGVAVDRKDMRPGDLVFFKNTYKRGVSHVGIYVGDGKFIHASSAGGKVEVDSLNSAYYTKKWAGARRAR